MITFDDWLVRAKLDKGISSSNLRTTTESYYRVDVSNSLQTGGYFQFDFEHWDTLVSIFAKHNSHLEAWYFYKNNGYPEFEVDYIFQFAGHICNICFNYNQKFCDINTFLHRDDPMMLKSDPFIELIQELISIEKEKPIVRLKLLTGLYTYEIDTE